MWDDILYYTSSMEGQTIMNQIQYALIDKKGKQLLGRTFDYKKEAEAALTIMARNYGFEVKQIMVSIQ